MITHTITVTTQHKSITVENATLTAEVMKNGKVSINIVGLPMIYNHKNLTLAQKTYYYIRNILKETFHI